MRYQALIACDVQEIGDEFSKKPYALAVQQGSPLKDLLNDAWVYRPHPRKRNIHSFFYKNQQNFWKGYVKNQIVLNAFKKAFLVLKFNFLLPKSLDILKE